MSSNPYDLAVTRYKNPEFKQLINKYPIRELAKLMGLSKLRARIRQAGQPAFIAMCGVVLYRQLNRHEQRDVLQRVLNLGHAGYPELSGKLYRMVTDNKIQPAWNPWSMPGSELETVMKKNAEIKSALELVGFGEPFNAMTIAGGLYLASKQGIAGTVKSSLSSSTVAELARKKGISAKAASGLGYAAGVVYAIGTVLLMAVSHDWSSQDAEAKRRQAPFD